MRSKLLWHAIYSAHYEEHSLRNMISSYSLYITTALGSSHECIRSDVLEGT